MELTLKVTTEAAQIHQPTTTIQQKEILIRTLVSKVIDKVTTQHLQLIAIHTAVVATNLGMATTEIIGKVIWFKTMKYNKNNNGIRASSPYEVQRNTGYCESYCYYRIPQSFMRLLARLLILMTPNFFKSKSTATYSLLINMLRKKVEHRVLNILFYSIYLFLTISLYARSADAGNPHGHYAGEYLICDSGYKAEGGKCFKLPPSPEYGHYAGEYLICDNGYKAESGKCFKLPPSPEYGHYAGEYLICDNGYKAEGGKCFKLPPSPEYGHYAGEYLICDNGYKAEGSTCLKLPPLEDAGK